MYIYAKDIFFVKNKLSFLETAKFLLAWDVALLVYNICILYIVDSFLNHWIISFQKTISFRLLQTRTLGYMLLQKSLVTISFQRAHVNFKKIICYIRIIYLESEVEIYKRKIKKKKKTRERKKETKKLIKEKASFFSFINSHLFWIFHGQQIQKY